MKNELFESLKNKSIISFDAETDGLWGNAFIISAVKYDISGNEVNRFTERCKAEIKDDWVRQNVVPNIENIPITQESYKSLLESFFKWYKDNSENTCILTHMGHIVEAKIIRDAHDLKIIGDWDAPYLWYDCCLFFNDSVDNYIKEHKLLINEKSSTHNPLYDCIACYKAFRHFISL